MNIVYYKVITVFLRGVCRRDDPFELDAIHCGTSIAPINKSAKIIRKSTETS